MRFTYTALLIPHSNVCTKDVFLEPGLRPLCPRLRGQSSGQVIARATSGDTGDTAATGRVGASPAEAGAADGRAAGADDRAAARR